MDSVILPRWVHKSRQVKGNGSDFWWDEMGHLKSICLSSHVHKNVSTRAYEGCPGSIQPGDVEKRGIRGRSLSDSPRTPGQYVFVRFVRDGVFLFGSLS